MIIVMGSQSQRRLEILRGVLPADTDIRVMPADIDEKAIRDPRPDELTLAIAKAKNEAVSSHLTEDSIVVTADSVAVFDGVIREKPVDRAQQRKFITSYSGRSVEVVTSVWVHRTTTGMSLWVVDRATVTFHLFTEVEISAIVDESVFYESSGGFLIEHPLMSHRVCRVDGNPETVQGLPGVLTKRLFADAGFEYTV